MFLLADGETDIGIGGLKSILCVLSCNHSAPRWERVVLQLTDVA